MAIKPEFMIERQGRTFVLYAGLLAEAHDRGLAGIFTELIQAPGPDNGDTAIVKAKVSLFNEDGDPLIFEGYGDANPGNVGKMIVPHLLRMAETRAKARALRDATNVGITSLEEIADEDSPSAQQGGQRIRNAQEAVSVAQEAKQAAQKLDRTEGGASRKAAGALWHRVGGKNGAEEWQAEHGLISTMSQAQVSKHLDELAGEGA